MDVMNRKLFATREARNRLRNMGGIMASSPELMQEAQTFQAGGPVQMLPIPSYRDMLMEAARRGVSPQVARGEVERGRLDPESEFFDPRALEAEILRMRGEGPMTYGSGALRGRIPEDEIISERLMALPRVTVPEGAPTPEMPAGDGPRASMLAPEEGPAMEQPEAEFPVYDPAGRAAAATRRDQETIRNRISEALGVDLPEPPASTAAPGRPATAGRPRTPERPDGPQEPGEGDEAPAAAARPPVALDEDRQAALIPDPDETPETLRDRYNDRLALFKDVLGTESDQAAQDKAMQLAMIGLAIAAGQSPDALTNIAQGALAGLESMSAAEAERRKQQRELRTSALESVLEEEAAQQEFLREAAIESIKDASGTRMSPLEQLPDAASTLAAAAMRNDSTLTLDEAMTAAENVLRRFPEYGGVPSAAPAPAPITDEQASAIRQRVAASRNDPAALEQITGSLIRRGLNPSDFGL